MNAAGEIIIRRMRECDIPRVYEIERESFDDAWDEESFAYSIGSAHDYGIVAVKDDIVCGFLIMRISFDTADIINVCVAEDYRHEGMGTGLLKDALSYGAQMSIIRYILEVRKSNSPAVKLYENEGFVTQGIRKTYYSNPVEDALIMIKES